MNPSQSSESRAAPEPSARRTPIRKLALLLVCLFLLAEFLLDFARPATREAARRVQCQNNLHQIGLALEAYHHKYGSFPPAFVADANGKPLYSWRVLILPYLGQADLAKQICKDEAWDGPNNGKLTQISPHVFDCPSDSQLARSSGGLTSYVAVVGPHSAWPGATPRKLSEFKDESNTILVVEAANSGIHWAEPRDLNLGQMPMGINPPRGQGISSEHPSGANVLFADGHVGVLRTSTDPKQPAEMLDVDGTSDQAKQAPPR